MASAFERRVACVILVGLLYSAAYSFAAFDWISRKLTRRSVIEFGKDSVW